MKKVKVPSGSAQKLETVFDNLQTYMKDNFVVNRFLKLFNKGNGSDQGGGIYRPQSDSSTNDYLKAVLGSQSYFTIAAGFGYTESGEYIEILTPITVNFSDYTLAISSTYVVKLKHAETGNTPATVQNGFLYDTVSSNTNRYTKYNDSYSVLVEISTDPTGDVPDTDELILAYFTTNGSGTKSAFTDLRSLINFLYINENFFDPTKILIKDRASTGTEKITADVEMGKLISTNFIVSGTGATTAFNLKPIINGEGGETATGLVVQPLTNDYPIFIRNVAGTVMAKFDPATGRTFLGSGTQGAEEVNINGDMFISGDIYKADGSQALFVTSTPTTPMKFRIYDVFPTTNKDERMGNVVFKWNLGPLTGTRTGATVLLTAGSSGGAQIATSDGEELTLDGTDASQMLGKYLFSTRTNNQYLISGYSYTTRVITISGSFSGTDLSNNFDSTYPAYVIDADCTGYFLKETSTPNIIAYAGASSVSIERLDDESYVTLPKYTAKLELNRKYNFYIKAMNENISTAYVQMDAGAYDPDHLIGNQASTSYTIPYVHTLPNILNTIVSGTESVGVTATTGGFSLSIAGWTNTSDIEQTPHEFYIQHFPTNKATEVQSLYSEERFKSFALTEAEAVTVKVAPVQNKQQVGDFITRTIAAGGGGVAPEDSLLFQQQFSMSTLSGVTASYGAYYGGANTPTYRDVGLTVIGSGVFSDLFIRRRRNIVAIVENGGLMSFTGILDNVATAGGYWDDAAPYTHVLLENTTNIPIGTPFLLGYAEDHRLIGKSTANVTRKLTRIEVTLTTALNTTNARPAVIRVYPEDSPESAATMEVYTVGTTTQNINLTISPNASTPGVIVVDAFDPDTVTPNNINIIAGTIKIYGKALTTQATAG